MKPDCQQVLTQFASFSVEELSDSEAATLLHHLEECEPCKGQWMLFEKTLTVVTQSGPHDEDVEQTRSQQMWLVCMEHARLKADGHSAMTPASKSCATASASSKNGAHHANNSTGEDAQNSDLLVASRVNRAIVGGAIFVLASSYFLAPFAAAKDAATPAKSQVVAVETVSYPKAPLIDYRSTFAFNARKTVVPVSSSSRNWVAIANYKSL